DADGKELGQWAPKMLAALRKRPELSDVGSEQQDDGLQVSVAIDRTTASRLGISPQLVDDTLYDAFGQRQISTIFTQLNQYRVVLEVAPEFQNHPSDLDDVYVTATPGGHVPLSAIARTTRTRAPLLVSHQGQFPVVTLSFDLAPGTSLGAAVDLVEGTA